jgi:hypothetical protein
MRIEIQDVNNKLGENSTNILASETSKSLEDLKELKDSKDTKDGKDKDKISKVAERAKKKAWYHSGLYPSYKSRCEDFKKLFKDVPDDERLVVGNFFSI